MTDLPSNVRADLRVVYRMQQLIDAELDDIIPDMQAMAQGADLCGETRMRRAQFSALQNVSRDTDSIEAILNWVRYQTGRYSAWRDGRFGASLLEALTGLETTARELLNALAREIPDVNAEDARLVRALWLRLIRQYVGQLQRYYVACQGSEEVV